MGLFNNKKDWQDAPLDVTGLTCYKVANDLHIGSEYQDNPNAEQELNQLTNDGKTILNGDIIDVSCCPKSEVNHWIKKRDQLKAYFGRYYVFGNHCLGDVDYNPCIITTPSGKKVGFAHGDLISDFEKWSKYRSKKGGAGFLKRKWVKFADDLDHLKAMRPLPKQFLPNAYEYCVKFELDVLVSGHFHPEAERRYNYLGKTIIILPAHKINELWL